MRTLKEVEAALAAEYGRENFHATIKAIQGFDYIPWDESNRLANRVFGFLGWSSAVVSCEYIQTTISRFNKEKNAYEEREFQGFKSIVRIEVKVWDEEHNQVITSYHDGVGFGECQWMGNKNPLDTASKAAKSDGISTAVKHFGDYFGLFLYTKEDQGQGDTTGYSRPTSSTADLGPRPSEAQARGLRSIGLSDEQIAGVPFRDWKAMLDAFWNKDQSKKLTAQQILDKYGLQGTPQPTAKRSYPLHSQSA